MEKNIIHLSAYNFLSRREITSFHNKYKLEEKEKVILNIENLVEKLSTIGLNARERHTELLKEYKILAVCDSKADYIYIIVIANDYPERFGFKVLDTLIEKYSKTLHTQLIDFSSKGGISLKNEIQMEMVKLEENFRDPSKIDIIHSINADVEDLKTTMKKGLYNLVNKKQETSDLLEQSEKIKDLSEDFSKNANAMKKETRWANRKFQILGGTIFTATSGFFIWKFFL